MKIITWVLVLHGMYGYPVFLDGFKSKASCEAAYVSMGQQLIKHGNDDPETFNHASSTDLKMPYVHQCIEVSK